VLASNAPSSINRFDQIPEALQEQAALPAGWPAAIHKPMAWVGSDFASENEYVSALSPSDIAELEEALVHFKSLGLDGSAVSRGNFPLPTAGSMLENVRRDLYQGKGFGVIRGLNPAKYSVEDLSIMHLGIQAHIANKTGRQDKKGNMMVHIVADKSSRAKMDHHRHSTAPITFHNEEAGDLVSWMTRSAAAAGGKCIISSAYTIYNILAASRPDLIRALAKSDWPFALPKFQCRPIIFQSGENMIMNFGRTPLLGTPNYPRNDALPSLTEIQRVALDKIEAIGRRTELEIATQAGDIHIINNLAILHRRDGFVNDENQKRHLVRMRLRDEELGWNIPQELEQEWSKAFSLEGPTMWHLQPMPDAFFPLRTQPN